MTSRISQRSWRVMAGVAFFAAITAVLATSAAAQTTQTDPRWQAWLGCWAPDAVPAVVSAYTGDDTQLCVVPADDPAAVNVVTIAKGKMTSREHIVANGQHQSNTLDTCSGWEQADWSADSRRVYLHAEYDCGDGLTRTSSGIFGFSLKGDLLDVRSVTSNDNTGVRVLRYRPVMAINPVLPQLLATTLAARKSAIDTARTAAAGPASVPVIADASRQVDVGVVEAWLTEIGQSFNVDATRLEQLSKAGVPDRAIDLMVAMSYPRTFALQPGKPVGLSAANRTGAPLSPMPSDWEQDYANCRAEQAALAETPSDCGWYDMPFGYRYSNSPGLYANSTGFYAYGYPYAPYGVGPDGGYGYGYYPYGTWFSAAQPIVIVPAGVAPAPHGQVVNGRGYTQGPSTGASGTSDASSSTSSSSSANTSSTSSSSDSSSSSSSSGVAASSGASSGGERTAHPR